MERKKTYLCDLCESQLEISHDKNLFTYEIKCSKCHRIQNININNLLLKKKVNEKVFICKDHKKAFIYHCLTCKEDICLYCSQDLHNNHKKEFLRSLKKDEINNHKCDKILLNLKKIIDIFLKELDYFKNEIIENINFIKSLIQKEYELISEIADINNELCLTSINIKNITNLINLRSLENNFNICKNFSCLDNFYEKLDWFNYINNEIKKGKFTEKTNKKKTLYFLISNKYIPINKDYYIYVGIDNNNRYTLRIQKIKDTSNSSKEDFDYETIFYKKLNSIDYSGEPTIRINNTDNNEKESSFFIFTKKAVTYITYNNIIDNKNLKSYNTNNINNLKLKEYKIPLNNNEYILDFIPLSIDRNILFISNGKISLYNQLFDKGKIIIENGEKVSYKFKINEKIFVYSIKNKMFIINITNDNQFTKSEIKINAGYLEFLHFFKDKNILFCLGTSNLYLINFNCTNPEIFQIIEKPEKLGLTVNYRYNSFEEDSIYFISGETNIFYYKYYLSRYKIIESELKCVSREEIYKTKENINIRYLIDEK